MKYLHRWSAMVASAAFFIACSPVAAQWQTSNHSVPIGRGVGATGFKSVAPGTSGLPLVSQGSSTDPVFGAFGTNAMPAFGSGDVSFASGGGAGTIAGNAVTNSKLAAMPANTVKCNATGSTANATDCTNPSVAGITLTPATNSIAQPLAILTNLPNSTTAPNNSTEIPIASYNLNTIRNVGDNIGVTGGAVEVNTFSVINTFGGSQVNGARSSVYAFLAQSATTNATSSCRCYIAGTFWAQSYVNDNGTGLTGATAKGTLFATNPVVLLGSGATNWLEITGGEVNIAVQTGASVYYKTAWSLVALNTDAVQGTVYDAALSIASEAGAVGWKNGILFSAANGQQPIASSGCILCTNGSSTVATGFDISSYTISGSAYRSPNFVVAGNGDTTVRHLSGGTTVPIANSCPGFSLAGGGSDFSGIISMTSGTTCSITFGGSFSSTAKCTVTPSSATTTAQAFATTSGATFAFGAAVTQFVYICTGT